MPRIFHTDLFGEREFKNSWLADNDILSTSWTEIENCDPFYLLIPQDLDLLKEYRQYLGMKDIFVQYGEGFKTHRDSFSISIDKNEIECRLNDLISRNNSDEYLYDFYQLKATKTWNLKASRKLLIDDENISFVIQSCLYRPFDNRFCIYHPAVMDRPRVQSQRHLQNENLAIATTRSIDIQRGFEHVFCTNKLMDHHSVSLKESNYFFPLYLYDHSEENKAQAIVSESHHNIKTAIIQSLCDKFNFSPTPELIFSYIYAVLHSPTYRARYAEFLKVDFPRIPITKNLEIFEKLSELGHDLIRIHLLKVGSFVDRTGQFEEQYDRTIAPGHPKYKDGKVIINKQGDGFVGVPEEVWNFYIGGYQVCHKWLKDRKGRTLSDDDIIHYQKIIVAIQGTITLMQKIDEAIPSWPIE